MAGVDYDLPIIADDLFRDRTRLFHEFLTDESAIVNHRDAILTLLRLKKQRLVISLDVLRAYNREVATGILYEPNEYLPAFDRALRDVIEEVHNPIKEGDWVKATGFYIGFKGSFGENAVSPRSLRSMHLGRMVALEGIVTKCE